MNGRVPIWPARLNAGPDQRLTITAIANNELLRRLLRTEPDLILPKLTTDAGPIVAVGRPGELFAPEGGARVYLDDDSWQATVLDSIERSRLIILHLVPDGWTWWEVGHALKSHDPTRVLGIVVGASLGDESYQLLRDKLIQEFGISLDPVMADYALYRFDADLTPRLLPLRWIPGVFWPFTPYRLSRSTLRPYLTRLGLHHRFSIPWWRERLGRPGDDEPGRTKTNQ